MSYSSKHAKAKHTLDIREFIKNKTSKYKIHFIDT